MTTKTSGAAIAAILLCLSTLAMISERPTKEASNGKPMFDLTPTQVVQLSRKAPTDCAAALTVAKYHLYVTHDMRLAERFFRLAYRCPSVDSIEGLLAVLHGEQHDEEIDRLVTELESIDKDRGISAHLEIKERRAYRTRR